MPYPELIRFHATRKNPTRRLSAAARIPPPSIYFRLMGLCVGAGLLMTLWLACQRASDPAVGTWKLNIEKSNLSGVNEQTIVIAKRDGRFQISEKGVRDNGSPFSVKYSVPADGGTVKYLEGGTSKVDVQMRRVNAGQADFIVTMNGQQVRTSQDVFSPDGKTLTVKVTGPRVHGPPVEQLAVYDRQ